MDAASKEVVAVWSDLETLGGSGKVQVLQQLEASAVVVVLLEAAAFLFGQPLR